MYPQVHVLVPLASHVITWSLSVHEKLQNTIEIFDANYKKANLPEIVKETCKHLFSVEQSKLLQLLNKYEELFDGC